MMKTEPECLRRDALAGKQIKYSSLDAFEIVQPDDPFGSGGLIGDANTRITSTSKPAERRGRTGDQHDFLGIKWGLRESRYRVRDELVHDAVAVKEDRPPHRELIDSQWPCWTARDGCDTSACHTSAWKDSTSGVRRSAGAEMMIATSASSASVPPGWPTMP